jgi:hypothetical protein
MALPEFPPRPFPESGLSRRVSRVFPASLQIRAGMRFARIALAQGRALRRRVAWEWVIADFKNQGKPGGGFLDSLVPCTPASLKHS